MLKKYLTVKWLMRQALPLLVLAVVLYFIFGRGTNSAKTVIPSKSPTQEHSANKLSASNPVSNNASVPASQTPSQKDSIATPAGGQLTLAEAQNFVSNHTPGQNGSGFSEQSTCNTTPRATCYIEFTNGGVTKQLEPKVAGNDGTVIWNWDIKDAGLTSGSWTIKAIAQLNNETKSMQDQRQLVIQ
jgi:hypothetical protein